ncbi:MAG: hypothetical protein AAGA03_02895 [Planctomycetota bacterium]
MPAKLMQPAVESLEALLNQARESQSWFQPKVQVFATATGGTTGPVGLKADKANGSRPSARAYQKAGEKGDFRYIKDMIRTSVSYPNCGAAASALAMVTNHFTVVEAKDHFTQPKPGGYVDFNLIVVNPINGHLCELQIHFDSMLHAKHHGGHKAYKVERASSQGAKIRQMSDPKARARVQRALWKGQSAYCKSRVGLHHDPDRQMMMTRFRQLEARARGNASALVG